MVEEAHTRNLLAWYGQVVADRGLTLFAFHVAHVIGQHVNRESGDAWPSHARICEMLEASRRGVQQSIDQLVARGHLSVTVQRGRNGSNRYRPVLKNARGGAHYEPENARADAHPEPNNARADAHPEQENARGDAHYDPDNARRDAHPEAENARGGAHPLRVATRTNHLIEPSDRESIFRSNETSDAATPAEVAAEPEPRPAKARRAKPALEPEAFDRFWTAYPRKVAKKAAQKIFERVISRREATVDELTAAAARYAAETASRDPDHIKHPTTWLNGGCWADEPVPERASANAARGGRRSNDFSATGNWLQRRLEADE